MGRMPLTARQRRTRARRGERVKAELRSVVLSLCGAAGVLLCTPWALGPLLDGNSAWTCKRPDNQFGACVGDALTALVVPAVAKVAIGALAGIAVALVLGWSLPGLKRLDR